MWIYVYAYEDKEKGGWCCWLETCSYNIRGVFDKMVVIWGKDKLRGYLEDIMDGKATIMCAHAEFNERDDVKTDVIVTELCQSYKIKAKGERYEPKSKYQARESVE